MKKFLKGLFIVFVFLTCVIMSGCAEFTDPANEKVQVAVLSEEYDKSSGKYETNPQQVITPSGESSR
ncbi:hypothetical protein [Methanococcus vannielii]|jgi:predicted component of type VI protein secretion system|nr:hypothetical protein [Methanococcus vannielii]